MLNSKVFFTYVSLLLISSFLVAAEKNNTNGLVNVYDYFTEVSEPPPPKPIIYKWTAIKDKTIHSIIAGEGIKIKIDPKSKQNIQVYSPVINSVIENGKLTLSTTLKNDKDHNVIIKNLKSIKQLEMHSNSVIFGKDSNKDHKPIDIISEDSSNISIQGMLNVNHLQQSGSGSVKITWINSDNLNINANSGRITLAGVAKKAYVWAHGNALVFTPHLRSTNTWISSDQSAYVHTNPIGYFYAHAEDSSLIEHRGNYKTITRISKDKANIIFKN